VGLALWRSHQTRCGSLMGVLMGSWGVDGKHVWWSRCGEVWGVRLVALAWLLLVCGVVGGVAPSVGWACENEALRVGASAGLPDCRAYELVTPADRSKSSQDISPGNAEAVAGVDGNSVALSSSTTFGTTPIANGSLSVFERTPGGWTTVSVPPANAGPALYVPELFSPDLSDVGLISEVPRSPGLTFQVGAPGGPFTAFPTVARVGEGSSSHGGAPHVEGAELFGASPDFSNVVLASTDHILIPEKPPTGTDEHAYDLYELAGGRVKLVNVSDSGSVIGKCGATLGGGVPGITLNNENLQYHLARDAVSTDGSKVFFTSPDPLGEGEGCPVEVRGTKLELNPPRLYMRVTEVTGNVEEGQTVEISAPQGASHSVVEEEEESKMPVLYGGASADGSRIFFQTERALTPGAGIDHPHLYEYDTQASEGERLKLIFQGGLHEDDDVRLEEEAQEVFVSAEGSTVYFYRGDFRTLYRYDAADGSVREIASMKPPRGYEPPEVSPNGQFFLFVSEGVIVPNGSEEVEELRGSGHNELYRYSSVDGSVVCVSCGPGTGPASGNAFTGAALEAGHAGQLRTPDAMPEVTLMSSDGSQVFFESEAALTPEVVSAGVLNVYEWETNGAGSCGESGGCTYVISRGNSAGESLLIGASEDGSNVFFLTHAQLVAQDVGSSFEIYDARVDGGFPVPLESVACLGDTCQSVLPGIIDPPLASSSPSGSGNLSPPAAVAPPPKPKKCTRGRVRTKKGKCVSHHKAKSVRRATRHIGGVK
jgi:hypothetical protein